MSIETRRRESVQDDIRDRFPAIVRLEHEGTWQEMRTWIEKHMKVFRPIRLLSGERGAASIEYAILGSLIAAVIVFTVATLGTRVQALFQAVTGGW